MAQEPKEKPRGPNEAMRLDVKTEAIIFDAFMTEVTLALARLQPDWAAWLDGFIEKLHERLDRSEERERLFEQASPKEHALAKAKIDHLKGFWRATLGMESR